MGMSITTTCIRAKYRGQSHRQSDHRRLPSEILKQYFAADNDIALLQLDSAIRG